MIEIWKPIPGYEGKYSASNMGNIRSDSGRNIGCIHKGAISRKGYKRVCLWKDSKATVIFVHKLILMTFTPNPDPILYDQINHIDGVKANNKIENLEWSNNSLNQKHAHRIGLKNFKGSRHSRAILDEGQVKEIKRLLSEHRLTHKKIANLFGVCTATIDHINTGRQWTHVK